MPEVLLFQLRSSSAPPILLGVEGEKGLPLKPLRCLQSSLKGRLIEPLEFHLKHAIEGSLRPLRVPMRPSNGLIAPPKAL